MLFASAMPQRLRQKTLPNGQKYDRFLMPDLRTTLNLVSALGMCTYLCILQIHMCFYKMHVSTKTTTFVSTNKTLF